MSHHPKTGPLLGVSERLGPAHSQQAPFGCDGLPGLGPGEQETASREFRQRPLRSKVGGLPGVPLYRLTRNLSRHLMTRSSETIYKPTGNFASSEKEKSEKWMARLLFLVYSIPLPSGTPIANCSAFLVFFLVYKHYVMLQFQLSRLCWLEIALQSAPSCSSWATSEKALIFIHSPLCTVLS